MSAVEKWLSIGTLGKVKLVRETRACNCLERRCSKISHDGKNFANTDDASSLTIENDGDIIVKIIY